jgi:hypothetical protein
VGTDDFPAAVRAYPSLTLATYFVGAGRDIFDVGNAEIAPEGGNSLVAKFSALVNRTAPRSKRSNLDVAV